MPFSGTVSTSVPGGAVELTLRSGHPWSGNTDIKVTGCSSAEHWDLSLRFPDWASKEGTRITLNGEHVETSWDDSYITVSRQWRSGDLLEVFTSVPVLVLRPHWRVDATRDCIAVQRGPLVHCIEADDLAEGAAVEDVVLDGDQPLEATYDVPADLEGYVKVAVHAWGEHIDGPGHQLYERLNRTRLSSTEPVRLTFVPYFARGTGFRRPCESGSRPPRSQHHWVVAQPRQDRGVPLRDSANLDVGWGPEGISNGTAFASPIEQTDH